MITSILLSSKEIEATSKLDVTPGSYLLSSLGMSSSSFQIKQAHLDRSSFDAMSSFSQSSQNSAHILSEMTVLRVKAAGLILLLKQLVFKSMFLIQWYQYPAQNTATIAIIMTAETITQLLWNYFCLLSCSHVTYKQTLACCEVHGDDTYSCFTKFAKFTSHVVLPQQSLVKASLSAVLLKNLLEHY